MELIKLIVGEQIYSVMRKTTVPCACGCKHFKEVGSIPNSLNSFDFEYTLIHYPKTYFSLI